MVLSISVAFFGVIFNFFILSVFRDKDMKKNIIQKLFITLSLCDLLLIVIKLSELIYHVPYGWQFGGVTYYSIQSNFWRFLQSLNSRGNQNEHPPHCTRAPPDNVPCLPGQ